MTKDEILDALVDDEASNYGVDESRPPDQIAELMIADLDKSYELVYVDYRDQLDDEQVEALVANDWETLWQSTAEWESDSQWESVWQIVEQLRKDLDVTDEEWDAFREDMSAFEEVRDEIHQRETGDWVRELAAHTGQVLLRIASPITEDDSLSYREVHPYELLWRLGLRATRVNLDQAAEIIDNTSTEYSVAMGYWLASVDVVDVYDLTYEAEKVRIKNPGFWLGNPFAGSGWAGQFEGEIVVDRSELRCDKAAFGYSWQEVCGCSAGAYPTVITQETP